MFHLLPVVAVGKDTGGRDESMDGVTNRSHQDPENISSNRTTILGEKNGNGKFVYCVLGNLLRKLKNMLRKHTNRIHNKQDIYYLFVMQSQPGSPKECRIRNV